MATLTMQKGTSMDIFAVAKVADELAWEAVRREAGDASTLRIEARSRDAKIFKRDTVGELQEVFEKNRLEVGAVHCHVQAKPGPSRLSIMYWIQGNADIVVSGVDRIVVDRVVDRLFEEVQASSRIAAAIEGVTFVRQATVSHSTEDEPSRTPSPTPTAPPMKAAEPGWWKRTWREHTALLVIAIVGGLAVLVIGAKLLGIGG